MQLIIVIICLLLSFFVLSTKNQAPVIDSFITVVDPSHLNAVRVNIENSSDSDGKIIKSEIDFGDQSPVSDLSDVIHTYTGPGKFKISIKIWDNKNALSQYSEVIDIDTRYKYLETTNSVFKPTDLKPEKKYALNIEAPQTQKLYKMILNVKNFSKKDRDLRKIKDKINDKNGGVTLNGIVIFNQKEINTAQAKIEKFIVLKEKNIISSETECEDKAILNLEIKEMKVVKDVTPPSLAFSLKSNSLTKFSSVNVVVTDESNTSTFVWNGNNLVLTTTNKNFNIPLSEGLNSFSFKSVDEFSNAGDFYLSNVTSDTKPPVLLTANPADGAVFYTNALPYPIPVSVYFNEYLSSGSIMNTVSVLSGPASLSAQLSVASEGSSTVQVHAFDLAGNESIQNISYRVVLDTTAPVLSFGEIPSSTNLNQIQIPIFVSELNQATTILKINGVQVLSSAEKSINYTLNSSADGDYNLEINSTDLAGNVANTVSRKITKDTTPAILSGLSPAQNSTIYAMKFLVSGNANEPLSSVSVNGHPLALSTDHKSFSGDYVATQQGSTTLAIEAFDMFGNITRQNLIVNISSPLLTPSLVNINPSTDGKYFYVNGSQSAARPGAKISVSTGIFSYNSGSAAASVNGSFSIKMNRFTKATVEAVDSNTGESASFILNFSTPTVLSGIVKDENENPLPGATVRIFNSDVSAVTDSQGVFTIPDSPTGDQTVSIDGSTILQGSTGPARKFSTLNISVSISAGTSNILPRPIYLVAIILDHTSTTITAQQPATVTSPNAPGVSLSIPANGAIFPDGSRSGVISIKEIPADKSAIPVLPNIKPDTVISLEPSGTRFPERVDLTLPNINELKPGEEAFILSLNSISGQWETDGVAVVSPDGLSLQTKPGMGISHFSETLAVPAKPFFESVQNPNLDGINISQGAMTESVQLPNYKSLGQSIAPTLNYNSSWAHPVAYVTNTFSIPRQTITYNKSISSSSSSNLQVPVFCIKKILSGDDAFCVTRQQYIDEFITQTLGIEMAWVPDSISSQTWVGVNSTDNSNYQLANNQNSSTDIQGMNLTNSIKTNKWTLTNNAEGTKIPNFSQISYALPLKDKNSQSFASGIYPSFTRYELKLKHLTITTATTDRKIYIDRNLYVNNVNPQQGSYYSSTTRLQEYILDQIFPKDIQSKLLVQNKSKSPYGKGWEFDPTQKLINQNGSRILLEETDGSLSTYSAGYPIETLFDAAGTSFDLKFGAGLDQWPNLYVQSYGSDKVGRVYKINALSGAKTLASTLMNQAGTTGFDNFDNCGNPNLPQTVTRYKMNFINKPGFSNIISLADGTLVGTNTTSHSLMDLTNSGASILGGAVLSPNNFNINSSASGFSSKLDTVCSSFNLDCSQPVSQNSTYACGEFAEAHDESGIFYGKGSVKQFLNRGTTNDYRSYDSYENLITQKNNFDGFNNPTGMTISADGKLIVADTGNNVVLALNLQTKMSKIIAGDFKALDDGDGANAAPNVIYDVVKNNIFPDFLLNNNFVKVVAPFLEIKNVNAVVGPPPLPDAASLYHPKGLAYDSVGNLYITTENGFIRKVDTQGIITTYAGRLIANDGVLASDAHAEIMNLSNPTGLLIDSDTDSLYVADTGHHRVLKIDMVSKMATTIAGNDSCEIDPKDSASALNASLCSPTWLGFDADKNLLVVDSGHQRIRRIILKSQSSPTLAYYPSKSADFSKLTKNTDGTFSRTLRDGTQFLFSTNGKQTSTVDRVGRTTTFNYDQNSRLSEIIDPTGQISTYVYAGDKINYFQDPTGRKTYFNFDGDLLTSILFPDNTRKTYEYDLDGRIIKAYDQKNNYAHYNYNEIGRLSSVVDSAGFTTQVSDFVSQSHQNPQKQGTGATTIATSATDARGVEVKLLQDTSGYMVKYKDGNGQITQITRAVDGRPLKIISPVKSVSMTYSNDFKDLIQTTNDQTNQKESFTYNEFGQLTSKTDAKSNKTQLNYASTTGLLVSEINPSSATTKTYTYNTQGLVTQKVIYPDGTQSLTSNFEYDAKGNQTKLITPDGKIKNFEYDLAGNVTKTIEKLDQNTSATTTYQYDVFNRLTKVTSPKNEITQYAYDENGNLLSVTDPNQNTTQFQYNSKNQLISKIDPEGYARLFQYDPVGNMTQETDPNGNVKNFTYTKTNNLLKAVLPDEILDYTYDNVNQMTSIASSKSGTIGYIRDVNGNVLQESFFNTADSVSYTMNYQYDANENKISAALNSAYYTTAIFQPPTTGSFQRIDYAYDTKNRLTGLTNAYNESFSFNFDEANRMTSIIRPGSRTDFSYNTGSMLSQIQHSANNVLKDFSEYAYDQRNFITQKRNPAGTFTYAYDLNGQLANTYQSAPFGNPESFTYDKLGNRTSTNGLASTYNEKAQRLTDDGSYTYLYDNNGNMLRKNSKNNSTSYILDYSSTNQLMQVQILDAPFGNVLKKINYKYDPVGRRIEKKVADLSSNANSFTRKYVYDGENIIAEFDSQKRLLASYTHSPLSADDVLSVKYTNHAVLAAQGGDAENAGNALASQSTSYFYLKDHLGSVSAIVDNVGNLIQRYSYSSFGNVVSIKDASLSDVSFSSAPVRNHFTFTGREYEPETGMYYYRARYYDPSTGRFLQQDPDPGKLVDPRTFLSKYVYVANNPVMMGDPSGKIFGIDDVILISIVVAAGFVQGAINVSAAKDQGYTGDKLWQTFFSGFITGGLQAFAGVVGGPGWAIGAAFLGGVVNNVVNQRIFIDKNSDGNIDWGQALISGSVTATGAGIGVGLGYAFGETLGLATTKYTGTLYSGGQGAADLYGIVGSHIPGSSAPSGISPCRDADICSRYQYGRGN